MKIDSGYWRDWEVWIQDTDGNPLPEYEIKHTPPQGRNKGVITLYLECKEDQAFQICVQRPGRHSIDSSVVVTIDGRKEQRFAYVKAREQLCLSALSERINGTPYNRSLRFTKLERNENAPQLSETDRTALGTIMIGLRSGVQVPAARRRPTFDSPPVAAVSEGIKKGNIPTLVGGELLGKSQFVWAYEFTQDPVVPECDITFTYGTRDHLMAQDIITVKRGSEGVEDSELDSASSVDAHGDDTDTKRKMQADIVTSRARHRLVFKNAVAGPSNFQPIPKRAASPNSSDNENDITYMNPPKTKKVKTEVIDLSDDDY